jgi:hypothetical protein
MDILAQIRFVNESRQSGRKASKPKDVKRLLTEKQKKAGGSSKKGLTGDETPTQSSIKWVSDSTESPPVMAIITITKGDGSPLPDVKITTETRAAHLLKLAGATDAQYISECGGNIGASFLTILTQSHTHSITHSLTRTYVCRAEKVAPDVSDSASTEGESRNVPCGHVPTGMVLVMPPHICACACGCTINALLSFSPSFPLSCFSPF